MASRASPGARALLEREGELELLEARLAHAVAGDGGLVVVEGRAGAGKTELLRAAAELGANSGVRVLRGRGSDLDQAFSFGLARQLFERDVAGDPALLDGGAGTARAVVAGDGTQAPGRDLFGSLQGLYWLVVNLAARAPLLLLADDIHWADYESLRWLVFLAERLEELPVLLVAAMRPAEPGADRELLDALGTMPGAGLARPAPLSPTATRSVVAAQLADASDAFADACHRATGGNPFLLGELLAELVGDGINGSAEEADAVLDFGSERVGRAVRRRLRRLPDVATRIAGAVAVLGPETVLADAAALAGCDEATAAKAADTLVEISVLTAAPALEFVHPVVRTAVYEQLPPSERQALHAAAASLLAGQGAGSERVARHLLRLPGARDPDRAEVLRSAARAASMRGAPAAAARYLRRALDETPDGQLRVALLHELGVAEATDRQHGRFVAPLREAIASAPDAQTRGRISLDLGRALAGSGDFRASVGVLVEGLEQLDDDGPLGVDLEAELLAMTFHEFTTGVPTAWRWERRLAQFDAGEHLALPTLACLVLAMAASRPPAAAAVALGEAIMREPGIHQRNSVVAGMLATGLIYAGAAASAGHLLDGLIRSSTEQGNRLDAAWQFMLRSEASLRLGQLGRAEFEARRGHALIDEGQPLAVAWSSASVVAALVARGALEEADAFLAGSNAFDVTPSFPLALLLTARAELHIAQGRAGAALQDARAVAGLLPDAVGNPWCCRWRAPLARALAALGRDVEARAEAERGLAEAERFGVPAARGAALRVCGQLSEGGEAILRLRESVAILEPGDARLEHAHSLVELGAALRRAGERVEAREILRQGLDASARTGARGLERRAHEELVLAGARPREGRQLISGRESLTAREDHVAMLAAAGLSNREIAERDVVTVKAVQWHLRNVYRKLQIRSRTELAEALGLAAEEQTLG